MLKLSKGGLSYLLVCILLITCFSSIASAEKGIGQTNISVDETVDTIEGLKGLKPKDGMDVVVGGYWKANDGGGIFIYDADNTEEADGGMFIASDNGEGIWVRQKGEDEVINIRWYGAKSGVEEDQAGKVFCLEKFTYYWNN